MRKLLEETLMGRGAYGLYSKVNSCEMFGYSMSSGFGSGRAGGSGFGKDFGVDTGHNSMKEQHLNLEIFPDPVKPDSYGKIKPLINLHLPSDFLA